MNIRVHECMCCGEAAKETVERDPQTGRIARAEVEGIVLRRCAQCGWLVCESCWADGWCCECKEDRAHAKPTDLPLFAGQQALFGEQR